MKNVLLSGGIFRPFDENPALLAAQIEVFVEGGGSMPALHAVGFCFDTRRRWGRLPGELEP